MFTRLHTMTALPKEYTLVYQSEELLLNINYSNSKAQLINEFIILKSLKENQNNYNK